MSDTATTGERLAAWRSAHDPKITLQSCADAVGVKHPTWIDWEKGNRSPSLEKALAVELFTKGVIEIEAWGFDQETLATITSVMRQRGIADRRAKRAQASVTVVRDTLVDPASEIDALAAVG